MRVLQKTLKTLKKTLKTLNQNLKILNVEIQDSGFKRFRGFNLERPESRATQVEHVQKKPFL